MSRIGLVGCVSEKREGAGPARDLYVSTLFEGRRAYVERTCDTWWVLSALHGLVGPDEILAPYNVALTGAPRARKRAWATEVLDSFDRVARWLPADVIEIHAGADYRDFGLVDGLQARGLTVEVPTANMRIGSQLHFYAEARPGR